MLKIFPINIWGSNGKRVLIFCLNYLNVNKISREGCIRFKTSLIFYSRVNIEDRYKILKQGSNTLRIKSIYTYYLI